MTAGESTAIFIQKQMWGDCGSALTGFHVHYLNI